MSAHKEVIIKLTAEQREDIREKLQEDVTHIKVWKVPGTVILAETINRKEHRTSGKE